MAGIGQGHERGDQTNQNDGLADGDVLTSPTLTNFNERGLMNGVVPTLLNNYNNNTRNTTNSGDCVCTKSGTQSIVIAVGTILVDGVFYEIGTQTLNAATVTAQYATYNSSTAPTLTSTNHQRILLVYFDPTISGNIGFVYGAELDTSGGTYPTSPDAHLVKQTIVLASVRLNKSGSDVLVAAVEDKRVFIRPGPFPVSSLINAAGNASMPANNFVSGNAGTAPVTDLGFIFARDPAGLGSYPDGSGGTHLFYQSDQRIAQDGPGGAYQITPTHRTSIKTATYTGGSPVNVTLAYSPLGSQDEATTKLIEVVLYKTAQTPRFLATLIQGLDYTISANVVTINATLGYGTPSHVRISYVHAGHTG